MLAFSDRELEGYHDYIQWLFPLPEGSMFNIAAPTIDEATFKAFRSRPELRTELRSSFERILKFYGFSIPEEQEEGVELQILESANPRQAFSNWVMSFNHNHLRITRIIRSLRVLGLDTEAKAFHEALVRTASRTQRISAKSLMFWRRAAERPLWIAPEDEDDAHEDDALQWLVELEDSESS